MFVFSKKTIQKQAAPFFSTAFHSPFTCSCPNQLRSVVATLNTMAPSSTLWSILQSGHRVGHKRWTTRPTPNSSCSKSKCSPFSLSLFRSVVPLPHYDLSFNLGIELAITVGRRDRLRTHLVQSPSALLSLCLRFAPSSQCLSFSISELNPRPCACFLLVRTAATHHIWISTPPLYCITPSNQALWYHLLGLWAHIELIYKSREPENKIYSRISKIIRDNTQ